MPADLEAIVAAARRGTLEFTDHYIHERMGMDRRPWYSEVIFGIAHGEPRIMDDDRGERDPRGAVCTIACQAPDGTNLIALVNYEAEPMRLITAYPADEENP
ncbi:MAG: DUF4258 domain-containing protein [Dehalococcoidia bacterium]|nr:DUF4258 domain-containing protein [Dehalococcoidia bacterium]MXZ89164.1 DUF4258 domain-containing protein [Dehalococcoidia bacterium]MYI85699.1 DUF4258 domain-containing protein [Dehalococcoidia bacterium]